MPNDTDLMIETTAAATGAIAGMVIAGPLGAYVGAVITPTVTHLMKGLLSPREIARIQRAQTLAVDKFYEYVREGSQPRQDIPLEDLHEVAEGMLLVSRNAYEERKIPLLANLIAKAPFTSTPIENLNQTLIEAERLSYRQLCLLSVIEKNQWHGELDLSDKPFMKEETKRFNEYAEGVYQDINRMIVDGLVGVISSREKRSVMMASGVGHIVPDLLVSLYPGNLLINALELASIPTEDVDPLIKILQEE